MCSLACLLLLNDVPDLEDELADDIGRRTPGGRPGGSQRGGGGRSAERPARGGAAGRSRRGDRDGAVGRGGEEERRAIAEDDPFLDEEDEMGDFIVDEGDEGERRRRAKRAAGTMVGLNAQAFEVI